jgi:RPA family protein
MPDTTQQFKRNVAYKFRIGDLLSGKLILNGEKFSYLEIGGKNVVRVNIVGNIVDKFAAEGESKYTVVTIDDGSAQIKVKTFGDDSQKLQNLNQGQTIIIIGVLRNWNNETYISPEIIKQAEPKYLLVRKFEIEKSHSQLRQPLQKEQIIEVKDKVLEKIKNSEKDGGIETERIILELKNSSPEIIHQEIKKLIEEGIIFEPRPGKVRWLG